MADTGSPWFIPYVEPGDLVRDYPAASEALGTAIAAGLSAAGAEGIGPNVVQTVKTDTFSTTSLTYVALTGMSATITPSTATSKVLLLVDIAVMSVGGNDGVHVRLMRGATPIFVGDAAGSRIVATAGHSEGGTNAYGNTAVFVDSPTSATAVTYSVEVRVGQTGTAYINRLGTWADDARFSTYASSITAIEVQP
jgi:hypothetical protein